MIILNKRNDLKHVKFYEICVIELYKIKKKIHFYEVLLIA